MSPGDDESASLKFLRHLLGEAEDRTAFLHKLLMRPWRREAACRYLGWAAGASQADEMKLRAEIGDRQFADRVLGMAPPPAASQAGREEKESADAFAEKVERMRGPPPLARTYQYRVTAVGEDGAEVMSETVSADVTKSRPVIVDSPRCSPTSSQLREYYEGLTPAQLRRHVKVALGVAERRGKKLKGR